MITALWGLFSFIAATTIIILGTLLLVYLERRILALFTLRFGPNRTGYEGIMQTVADAIKLLIKEDCAPKERRKILFFIAPLIMFCPIMTAFCLIPISNYYVPLNIAPGLILLMSLISIPVIGAFLAGFSSGNKYSLLGAMRTIVQALSFEIPLGICVLAVTFMAGTLNINEIILAQSSPGGIFSWYFIPQILGCTVFFICTLALLNRTPFDLSEAESELVSGYNVEYSGMKFALFFLGEYALLFLISLIFTALYFGGYLSPFGNWILPNSFVFLEQVFWLILKTFLVILTIILIRAALPRLRYDRLLEFSYKILLPLALINLNAAILIRYFMAAR